MAQVIYATPRRELGGRAAARNKEIDRALALNADYILWLDSDQTVSLESLSAMFTNIIEADIVICDAPSRGKTDSNIVYNPDGTLNHFTVSCCLMSVNWLWLNPTVRFNSQVACIRDGIKEGKLTHRLESKYVDDNIGEDTYFAIKALEAGARVVVLPDFYNSRHLDIGEL